MECVILFNFFTPIYLHCKIICSYIIIFFCILIAPSKRERAKESERELERELEREKEVLHPFNSPVEWNEQWPGGFVLES